MDTGSRSTPGLLLRTLRFPLVSVPLLYCVLLYVHLSGILFMQQLAHGPVQLLAVGVPIVANLLLVYVSFAYFVERRPIRELALPGMAREFGIGLLLGFGLYTASVLIAMAVGIYRIDGFDSWQNAVPTGAALSVPVFQGLAFRGVVFRTLEKMFGSWIGLALSSLVFGLVHLSNQGESLAGIVSIAIVFGPLLTAPFLLARWLWMSLGLHMTGNYTMGKIFSGNVSGAVIGQGLFKTTFEGPELLTGGSAGMEDSLIAILVGATATALILILAVRRGNIVPPSWNRVTTRQGFCG